VKAAPITRRKSALMKQNEKTGLESVNNDELNVTEHKTPNSVIGKSID